MERNRVAKIADFLKTNEKASLRTVVRSLNRNFPRTPKIEEVIKATRHQPFEKRVEGIMAEYLRTYPQHAKSLLLTAMPIVRGGTKITNKQDLVTLQQLQEFYHNVIPHFLGEIGLEKFPNPFSKELDYINGLVKKYARAGKVKVPTTFRLSAGKTVLDSYPGVTGQTCLRLNKLTQDLHDPRFHVIQIINTKTGKNEGTIQAHERIINGERHLILSGVEPKARLVRQVAPSQLYKKLMAALATMAARQGFKHLSSATTRGTVSNRGEMDARMKQNPVITLKKPIRLFPTVPKYKDLFHIKRLRYRAATKRAKTRRVR
jgi:hypothetical protein